MLQKFIIITFFIVMFSYVLFIIPNKSNFPHEYIIPLIVAMLIKYMVGDFDKGYIWSYSDIIYWLYIFISSYGSIIMFKTLLN